MREAVNPAGKPAPEAVEEPLCDPLTGLPGNVFFELEGAKDLAFAKRHCTDMALLYFRIDIVAELRNRFGAATADRAVHRFVDCLRASVRAEDTIARLSNDHFGVIARQTGALGARLITQRTLRRMHEGSAETRERRLPLSIGLASPRPYQIESFESYIQLAGSCLHTAVAEGGDRVVAARSAEGLKKLKPRRLSNHPEARSFEPADAAHHDRKPMDGPVVYGFQPRPDVTMWLVEEGFIDQLDPDVEPARRSTPPPAGHDSDVRRALEGRWSQVG